MMMMMEWLWCACQLGAQCCFISGCIENVLEDYLGAADEDDNNVFLQDEDEDLENYEY